MCKYENTSCIHLGKLNLGTKGRSPNPNQKGGAAPSELVEVAVAAEAPDGVGQHPEDDEEGGNVPRRQQLRNGVAIGFARENIQ